jgi:hypothetical protein
MRWPLGRPIWHSPRLDRFAETIAGALPAEAGWDEVLLVSHSNGAILAAEVTARLLARHGGALPPRLALVTLGASLPMLGARRDAHGFAQTMATLAQGRFAWLDIGSPTDGAATPLVDPWLGQPPPGWPGWSSFRPAGSRSAIRPPMPRGARTSISPISIICAGSIGPRRSITWA